MEGLTFLSQLSIFIRPPAEKNEIWAANIVVDKNSFNGKRKREVESAIYCVVIFICVKKTLIDIFKAKEITKTVKFKVRFTS